MNDETTGGRPGSPDDVLRAAEATAMARLRAADPALMASTDLRAMREHVALRSAEPVTVHPIAAVGHDRRPRWVRAAAIAAGFALVGGTGYIAGRSGHEPVDERATSAADPAASTADRGTGSKVSGEIAPSTADSAALTGTGTGMVAQGRYHFTASDLPAGPENAHAYSFDGSAWRSAGGAEQLATIFGVKGKPADSGGSWIVGEQDGVSPTVMISDDQMAYFSYSNPAALPWCGTGGAVDSVPTEKAMDSAQAGGGVSGTATAPATATAPSSVVTSAQECVGSKKAAPDDDAAISLMRSLVKELLSNADVMTYEVTSRTDGKSDGSSFPSAQVTATLTVDGAPTDVLWSATVTADGIEEVSGSLAIAVDLGEYPVVSPMEAVNRLGDSRFGVLSTQYPDASKGTIAADDGPFGGDVAREGLAHSLGRSVDGDHRGNPWFGNHHGFRRRRIPPPRLVPH